MGSAKVVVGVANDRSSKGALKWTLKNLDSDVITLLHICPPVRTIPTPMGKQVQIEEVSQEIVAAYLRDVKSKIDEFLLAYKRICESYKVVVECVIVENDSVEKGLLDYVSRYRIRKLVLGTSRLNAVTWKLMRPGLSVRVSKEAPAFCDVLLISKHRLHLVKDAKFHSSLSKSKSSASDVSNALVATSLYHHSLSSPSQGEIEVHSKARWFEQATAKLSKTWGSSSQLLSLQKRHATTLLNRLDDSALAPDANFTGSNENQLFISPLGSSRLWNIGQRPRETTTTRDFLEEDLQSYLSDLRSEDLHEDSESQLSPFSCCSQATGIDQSLWKHSDSTASQGVHSSCQQCSRGQVLHPHHHKLKVHEDFSTATRSCSDWSFISHRKSHVQSNQKLYLLSEKEGSQEPANKAMLLSHDSPSSTPMGMPSRLSPETYEEKVEMLREQLDQALHLAEKARKDADIQTMYRIKAEKAAIWAAEKVELLCRIHHPHMVLLLGCCPEKGCLVYEYMANGSLEDRLICKGNTPPLHWSIRFRIIAEIANALDFLHSSQPDPVVHRDLKPGNILLDQNLVSKLSDVGLARLVPERLNDSNTLYPQETVPVGTFAYIDPEYQRTGVFGPKSDLYALGIVILQLLTGKPAVGVYEMVEEALSNERLYEVLDDSAGEWPHLESMELASLALQCAEMKRKHRPDLESGVLPILDRTRAVAEEFTAQQSFSPPVSKEDEMGVPSRFLCPILQEVMEDPVIAADGYTYDYKAIKQWFKEHDTSPLTNLELSGSRNLDCNEEFLKKI
ncbi:hypothetical protein O6H91_06G058900 [Diphasiastrum complanatum]|uniref:Uncharacterized protein n=1 Tax=Diphasiastrum complanatum TaxID=34168 RepID=A0ACC2DDX5_DIPCM|nr:hypothetical protein O6H91_06G058900 [Diphasiastrum complanatum]